MVQVDINCTFGYEAFGPGISPSTRSGEAIMGLSTLLLLGLVVGGYVLSKRYGGGALLRTLRNPATSRFTRRSDESGSAVFDVTPARVSWTIIGLSVVAVFAGFVFPPLWLFVGVLGFFLFIGARHRVPVRCSVSGDMLRVGDRSWPISDIAGLQVRRGSRRGTEEVGTVVTTVPGTGIVTGGKPTSALVGKALGGRMAERSYLLTVRTRRSSEEEVIAGGLTLDCAEALLHDLQECVAEAKRAGEPSTAATA